MNTTPNSSPDGSRGIGSALAAACTVLDSVLRNGDRAPRGAAAFDDDLLEVLSATEAVGRRVDALRAATAAEVAERSHRSLGSDGLAAKKGCRSGSELIRRLTVWR